MSKALWQSSGKTSLRRFALAAASWDVTSDSLAAWLACRLGARRLVLIKQIEVEAPKRADELCADGVIDPALAGFLKASGLEAMILGPQDYSVAAAAFARREIVGRRIEVH